MFISVGDTGYYWVKGFAGVIILIFAVESLQSGTLHSLDLIHG